MSTVIDTDETYDLDEVDNFLEHYGVKGMKWGKRKVTSKEIGNARKDLKSLQRRSYKLEDQLNRSTTKGEQRIIKSDLAKLDKEYKNTARTAQKFKLGEKVAVAVLLSPLALVPIAVHDRALDL